MDYIGHHNLGHLVDTSVVLVATLITSLITLIVWLKKEER
jgi:hypothetical protein